METTFTDDMLSTMDDPPLNLRELRGLNQIMQTIRGELVNNLSKLTALDEHVALEERKLTEVGDDEEAKREISERMQRLQDEREARLEAASANREALRTQINRIRETISRVIHEDTTLGERLRTLFREQGVTIVSIMTALGFIVSTLVLALTGGGAATVATAAGTAKGGIREWAKSTLKALGRALAKLAGKAAAALPGIVGSIVSWLLTFLSKTAGWLSDNIWHWSLPLVGYCMLQPGAV